MKCAQWMLAAVLAVASRAEGVGAVANDVAPRDWFHVVALDKSTYAISEPKYWQQNVSYLLLGSSSALLFDTGPGVYSLRRVIESLTPLPVLVIPSHLHFDHIGRIQEFSTVAVIANESLRRQAQGGVLRLAPGQCLLREPCSFPVARWLADGETIDLGGRRVAILSTPGHTPDSVTLQDPGRHRMFTGDLLNRFGTLYDVPGSDLGAVARSLARLAALSRGGDVAYEAHSEQPIRPQEFLETREAIDLILAGGGLGKSVCLDGTPARQFDANGFMVVLPSDSDRRLGPLASSTTEMDWCKRRCP